MKSILPSDIAEAQAVRLVAYSVREATGFKVSEGGVHVASTWYEICEVVHAVIQVGTNQRFETFQEAKEKIDLLIAQHSKSDRDISFKGGH